MTIKFPRKIIKVNHCIAVVKRNKEPYLDGRPKAKYKGLRWSGSRLSYHLNVSKIQRCPGSYGKNYVLHTCDNGWCVNPFHLYLGSDSENKRDFEERNPGMRSKKVKDHWASLSKKDRLKKVKKMTIARLKKYPNGSNESYWKKMSKKERSEHAKHAALSLWNKRSRKEKLSHMIKMRAARVKNDAGVHANGEQGQGRQPEEVVPRQFA